MKKQRILSFLLALVMTVSLLPGTALAAKTEDFTDVSKNDWYYTYVDFVTDNKYFVGTSDTTFSPEMSMNRAMFVVVLAALEGVKVDNSVAPFADVPANTWYSGAVAWAAESGVVAGIGDNKFGPDIAISREQMAVMMDAYVDWHSAKHGEDHKVKAQVTGFGDSAKVASWAAEAVENCRAWGLIAGAPDGNFYPQNTATRAEVATVIYNLAWLVYGGGSGGGHNCLYTSVVTAPTCVDKGYTTYTCTKCGDSYVADYVDALGHDFTGDYLKDDAGHWHKCSRCDATDNKAAHNWDAGVVTTEPTETEAGVKTFTCVDCKHTKTETIPAQGSEVQPVDYIYNALKNIEVAVKDKAQEKLENAQDKVVTKLEGTKVPESVTDVIGSIEIADKNGDGQFSYGVENGGSYVVVSGVTVGEPNAINTTEHETIAVEAQIEADSNSIIYVVETAVSKAVDLMGITADKAPTQEEIQQIVDDIVVKLQNKVEGIDITKAEAKEIAKAVYAKVEAKALAGLNYTKELWVANFKVDGHYITDDITITCGDVKVVITVDDVKGAYYEGSKKDAIVDLAVAMAKDLYADLKACTTYTGLDKLVLDASATVTFSRNANAAEIVDDTDLFPYVYPVTASLKVTGSAADNIQYKYSAKDGHFVKVLVTAKVKDEYETIVNDAVDEVILEGMDLAMDQVVAKAVESVDTYPKRADLIDALASDDVTSIYNRLLQLALNEYIGSTEYAAILADLPEDLAYYVEALICDELIGQTKFATEVVGDNGETITDLGKAAATNLSLDQMLGIAEAAGAGDSNYAEYIKQLSVFGSIDTLKDIDLGDLAVILNTEVVKTAYANGKDIVIDRLTDLVRFIPDEAAVVIAGKTITEETLAGVRDAETVGEACQAAAKLLSNLKGLSLSDFDGEGQNITVKYNGVTKGSFTLVIDFQ